MRFKLHYPIRYFLDINDYSERRTIIVNQVSGKEELTTNSDFRKIGGIRVPFKSELTVDGKLVHKHHITDVKLNYGAMNWMFARPSTGYLGKVISSSNKRLNYLATPGDSMAKKSLNSTFGSYFGMDSVFNINPLDYESDQIDAILRDAGVAIPAKN